MKESAPVLSLLVLGLAALLSVSHAQAPPDAEEPTPAAAASYRIGVEDELRIFVWGEPDISGRAQVRPDGRITVPLAQDIVVSGLTTEEVRRDLTEALSQYVRDPNVTVIVEQINSYRVYFLGEISRQGALQFYRPTRLLQGIAAAGGLTEFAKKEITLIREENGAEKRFTIDYKRLMSGDPSQENFYLESGDTLICK